MPGEASAIDVQNPNFARRINHSLLAINAALIITSVLAFRRARTLERLLASPEGQQLLAAAVAVKRTHGEVVAEALEMRLDEDRLETLHDFFESQVLPATAQLGAILLEFVEHKTTQLNEAARNTSMATTVAWWSLLILALVNIVVSPLVARVARRTVNALHARAADLERAVHARENFLAVASHELRTPLSVLKLQIQILKRRLNTGDPSAHDAEAMTTFTNQMDHGVNSLTLLVDRMLDVANIEQGQLVLNRQQVDLAALTSDVIERLAPQFAGAGMGLGLTVTRQIVRARGRIWVEGGECRGARFVVELPARQRR